MPAKRRCNTSWRQQPQRRRQVASTPCWFLQRGAAARLRLDGVLVADRCPQGRRRLVRRWCGPRRRSASEEAGGRWFCRVCRCTKWGAICETVRTSRIVLAPVMAEARPLTNPSSRTFRTGVPWVRQLRSSESRCVTCARLLQPRLQDTRSIRRHFPHGGQILRPCAQMRMSAVSSSFLLLQERWRPCKGRRLN